MWSLSPPKPNTLGAAARTRRYGTSQAEFWEKIRKITANAQRRVEVSAANRLGRALSKEIQLGAGAATGRSGGKRHSPEGPALFCSK